MAEITSGSSFEPKMSRKALKARHSIRIPNHSFMKVIDMDSLLPHYSSKQHALYDFIGPFQILNWVQDLGNRHRTLLSCGGSLGVSLPLYTHYSNDCPCINSLSLITQCLDCDLQNMHCFAAIETVTSPEFFTPPSVRRQGSREQLHRKGGGRPPTPAGDSSGAFNSCSSADVSINYGECRVGMPELV